MDRQLIYIILAIVIVIFIFMTIRDWQTSKKPQAQQAPPAGGKSKVEITLPLCLQAYERLVLFLERIKPEILINRVSKPGLSAREMRKMLTGTIQLEFEHNLSQQVYVSTASWEAVCNAKEQLISLINSITDQLPADATGAMLSKSLLELSLNEKELPVPTALTILNAEAKKLINPAVYS
jgi:hypothetical protein